MHIYFTLFPKFTCLKDRYNIANKFSCNRKFVLSFCLHAECRSEITQWYFTTLTNLISTKELLLRNQIVLCLHLLIDRLILVRWRWVGWWSRSSTWGLWYRGSRDKCWKKTDYNWNITEVTMLQNQTTGTSENCKKKNYPLSTIH